ncbi:LysR substrate-binding domain-containing protein [Gemmobacter fulvus]|uniref:LysR substrate-binding domain-containing protein n=1 Tax=Gemmobacter fulvus TaxID=2840474 RepID=UPI0027965B12|nr:LysR substrate-binding domain-containing protein [Gemmobacter fulvus]MDQ1850159.1 LysR substrate-binding domain-containing protein [Gemmobacter fulvus]
MHALPPLTALRAFEAVVRTGTLSAAARDLGITHGAVSLQIRALEQAVGQPLFARPGKRLVLNGHGARLFQAVSAAFQGMATATAHLRAPVDSGRLRIACVPALLSHWLLQVIDDFAQTHPEVELHLIPANDPQLVLRDAADLCLCYGDRPDPAQIHSQSLAAVRLFPVASPALLTRVPLKSWRGLQQHVLLHADDGQEWREWAGAAPCPLRPTAHRYLSDARLVLEAAILGHGIALGDTITTGRALARGDLVVPFAQSVMSRSVFYLACHPARREVPLLAKMSGWLAGAMEATGDPLRLPAARGE